MIKKCMLLFLLVSLLGCNQGRTEFVNVIDNHRELVIETNNAVIASIKDDMDAMEKNGTLTIDARKGAEDLISRLEMIESQSIVIRDYVYATAVDEELMSRLAKEKWKGE